MFCVERRTDSMSNHEKATKASFSHLDFLFDVHREVDKFISPTSVTLPISIANVTKASDAIELTPPLRFPLQVTAGPLAVWASSREMHAAALCRLHCSLRVHFRIESKAEIKYVI